MFGTPTAAAPHSRTRRWVKRIVWGLGLLIIGSAMLNWKAKSLIADAGGSESAQTLAKLKTLELMLEARRLVDGHYPSQEAGLLGLFPGASADKPNERLNQRLKDGWGRLFHYRVPGVHRPEKFDLFSVGPDGIEGTEDDVTNW